MDRYAVIDTEGHVRNIVLWDGESEYDVSPSTLRLATDEDTIYVEPVTVKAVSPVQIRKALYKSGLLETVNGYVAGLGEEARLEWEFATVIERDNHLIVGGAEQLGMTAEQVNGLFALAASL